MFNKFLQGLQLNKSRQLKRSRSGAVTLNGLKIKYLNGISTYYEYQDIFIKKIYHFETNKTDPIIIDAGGCIGMATLYFKTIHPQAKVIIFEPDPKVFSILKFNMEQNNIKDVTTLNLGLRSEECVKDFYSDGSDGGSMVVHDNTRELIRVNIDRLSKYINQPIDF